MAERLIISKDVREISNWLQAEIDRRPFGEIGIKIVTHAGRIKRIEKTLIEKEQPDAS
jgi:hypothetical protein